MNICFWYNTYIFNNFYYLYMRTPNWLTLWKYDNEVLDAIEKKWWKLWLLELIANNLDLSEELRKNWIIINSVFNPVIIQNKKSISKDEYDKLIDSNLETFRLLKWKRNLWNWDFLIRVSASWDFRSLVDVFPTHKLKEFWKEWVNEALDKIKKLIDKWNSDISNYAIKTWVPYDKDTLTFWVVPKIDSQIITVTENPNNNLVYVDKNEWENNYWKLIDNLHYDSETGKTYDKNTKEYNSEKFLDLSKKLQKFLDLLRKNWILDKNIAYQLELWYLETWEIILFQVKEFAKKQKLNTIFNGILEETWIKIYRVISWFSEWEIDIPVIYWRNSDVWFNLCKKVSWNVCLVLWNNSHNLNIDQFNSNILWFLHVDWHWWVFNHNSFRQIQATVQAWWIALMGMSILNPNLNSVFNNSRLKTKKQNWNVDIEIDFKK